MDMTDLENSGYKKQNSSKFEFKDFVNINNIMISKIIKNNKKKILQEIYDQIFKYLELSVREMGYGDATINKKMKNYLNTFHSILEQINNWESKSNSNKSKVLAVFLDIDKNTSNLIEYFDNYIVDLSNNTLNFYIKGVVKDKF
mgnify:CR=1 FL=1